MLRWQVWKGPESIHVIPADGSGHRQTSECRCAPEIFAPGSRVRFDVQNNSVVYDNAEDPLRRFLVVHRLAS